MLSVTVAISPLIKPDSKAASSAITAESLNVFSAARAKDSEIFTTIAFALPSKKYKFFESESIKTSVIFKF